MYWDLSSNSQGSLMFYCDNIWILWHTVIINKTSTVMNIPFTAKGIDFLACLHFRIFFLYNIFLVKINTIIMGVHHEGARYHLVLLCTYLCICCDILNAYASRFIWYCGRSSAGCEHFCLLDAKNIAKLSQKVKFW